MARFLLVHGTSHGAWCWRDLIPALTALGHEAVAIDLPSHGGDTTPVNSVTLDDYAKAITRQLTGPTILVGHSSGGFAITAAAERDPTNIAGLVYLCAYIPETGKSLVDLKSEAEEQPLKGALDVASDRKSFRFKPEVTGDLAYHDCPPGTAEMARHLLGWQALAPQTTPLTLTDASEGLPKSAILTTQDRIIPPAHQAYMARGISECQEMNTGHSPFFAAPEDLAARLAAIADAT